MSMDVARWETIERLFGEASELPAGDREAFLERATDDAAVRSEVFALLAASEDAGRYFATLANRAGVPAVPDLQPERLAGKVVGRYRLLRLIGRGGMGAVYLAERADGEYEQRVAVKLLPAGIDSEDTRRRFLHERQILARLQHPGITRLLDGGVTDDGTPYFVLEHVEGLPLDEHCDLRGLGIEARLRLVLDVCDAVEYAHRNLIVHRDLKPDNILVTADGTVKLLDFGIARLLEPNGATGLTLTRHARPLTPAFASPEQLAGSTITTASDVYGLGVLLYLILAGRHPFDLEGKTPTEVEEIVCHENPDPPSAAAGGQRLEDDLDAVVLMALRKEPERRYPSARELAEDVGRYLDGHPVRAHKDTLTYRVSRFVRRHRTGVLVAAMVAVLLGVLGVVLVRSAATSRAQAAAIAEEAATAEQVTAFLVDLFAVSDTVEGIGDTITARALLHDAAERLRTSLEDQPLVRARLLSTVADVYQNLGLVLAAESLLADVVASYRLAYGDSAMQVAEALIRQADLLTLDRNWDWADEVLRNAIAILESQDSVPATLSGAYLRRSTVLRELDRLDSARTFLERALEQRRATLPDSSVGITDAYHSLALLARRAGDHAAARVWYDSVLARFERHGADTAREASLLHNLAFLLEREGALVRAESLYRRSYELNIRTAGPANRNTAIVHGSLSGLLERQGRNAEVLRMQLEYLDTLRKYLPSPHWRVGATMFGIANFHMRHSRPIEAEPWFLEAIATYRATLGPEHAWSVGARASLGACLVELGRYEEAEPLLREGFAFFREANGLNNQWTQGAIRRLVQLYDETGRAGLADELRPLLSGDAGSPSRG